MQDEKEIDPEIGKLNHPAIAAHIIFDSSVSPVNSGFRGIAQDRHLLFVAQGLDIHVKIVASKRHREIHGQVIHHTPPGESMLIQLCVQEEPKDTTTTDSFGEFSFHEVPIGNVTVEILKPSRRIAASFSV